MIKRDLPDLPTPIKQYALEGMARAGLTLADCIAFFAKHRTTEELEYVVEAKKQFAVEGELEIDDNAPVSMSDEEDAGGAYVSAWVWTSKED